jgi:hypothetical protein
MVATLSATMLTANSFASVSGGSKQTVRQAKENHKLCEPYSKVYIGQLSVNKKRVKPCDRINVRGGGFCSNADINISLPDYSSMVIKANDKGEISFNCSIPKEFKNGMYSISAEGSKGGKRSGKLVLSATIIVKSKKQNRH